MADCNAECIRKYTEGKLQLPPEGAIYAPFVIAMLSNGSVTVTVGNESAPKSRHSAAIKSFQFGVSNGTGATIEIVDEEGGHFEKFFSKITHKAEALSYTIRVQWGWIVTDCNGQSHIGETSQFHNFIITKVAIKYEAKIKFVLECTDLMQFIYETRQPKTYGQQGAKMGLKDAIRQLCKDNVIPINNVRFLRKTPDGKVEPNEWEFKKETNGVWQADGQHVLDTLTRWLKSHTTDRDKGVVITWDSTETEPTLILWEDPKPKPNENFNAGASIGSYIVNGGQCSPVLSFNPEIKWLFTMLACAGGFIDSTTGKIHNQRDENCPGEVGITTTNQVTQNSKDIFGDDAAVETIKASKAQQRADSHYSIYQPISAELRIVGNPKLDQILLLIGSTVGIAVVNPFNITSGVSQCEWRVSGGESLAESSCNAVLSNKRWVVKGVAHDIREGSYITSLSVYLPAPGQELSSNQPLGGTPTGFDGME